MRLLDRYLLRELLHPLGYCLGGFLLLWITSDLLRRLDSFQAAKLRFPDVAAYYAATSPEFLVVVLPIALLLALLYALTNHTRHHELAAIRAAGVSLWRLARPYFAVGFLASAVLFLLNEFAVPDSDERAERILHRHDPPPAKPDERHLVRNLGFTNARDGHHWQIAAYNLNTGEMTAPQVDYLLGDGSRRWLFAARALRTNATWLFLEVREYREDPRTNTLLTPLRQADRLALARFTETPEQIRSEINITRRLDKNFLRAREADLPVFEILDYLRLHPRLAGEERHRLFTKLHGRLAAPWTCVVVVLIALPFGAGASRRHVFAGVAGSVFLCLIYLVLLQVGLVLGTGGFLPPWLAAWTPNLLFGLAGAGLTMRVR